eukprot:1244930-Rhodomonas_salina.2
MRVTKRRMRVHHSLLQPPDLLFLMLPPLPPPPPPLQRIQPLLRRLPRPNAYLPQFIRQIRASNSREKRAHQGQRARISSGPQRPITGERAS